MSKTLHANIIFFANSRKENKLEITKSVSHQYKALPGCIFRHIPAALSKKLLDNYIWVSCLQTILLDLILLMKYELVDLRDFTDAKVFMA